MEFHLGSLPISEETRPGLFTLAVQSHVEQPLIQGSDGMVFLPLLVASGIGVLDSEKHLEDAVQPLAGITGQHSLVVDQLGDVRHHLCETNYERAGAQQQHSPHLCLLAVKSLGFQ